MYAVVETGGKQYSATPGGTIDVEKLPGEAGEQITLDQVLLIVDGENVTVGRPTVAGAHGYGDGCFSDAAIAKSSSTMCPRKNSTQTTRPSSAVYVLADR